MSSDALPNCGGESRIEATRRHTASRLPCGSCMKVTRARLSYRLRMSTEQRSIVGNEWRITPACRLVIVFLAMLAGCDSPQSPSTSTPLVLVNGRVIDYTKNVRLAN